MCILNTTHKRKLTHTPTICREMDMEMMPRPACHLHTTIQLWPTAHNISLIAELWCIRIYLVIFLTSPFGLLILSSNISPFVTSPLLPFCSGLEYFPFHILDHVLLSPLPLSQTTFRNLSFYVDLTIVPPL